MKKLLYLLLCFFIISSTSLPVYANTDSLISSEDLLNPYVKAFDEDLKSKNIRFENVVHTGDMTISSLKEYYNLDIELATQLTQITGNNIYKTLVSSVSKEDKIQAMKLVINDFKELLDSNMKLNIWKFFDRYAIDSADEDVIEFYRSLSNEIKDQIQTRYTYNGSTAATWARNNYNVYSPMFPNMNDMGGDCANFVSQALNQGGISMFNTWYCYRNNTTYPKPANTTQLDYSWNLADPSPWISAVQFQYFWASRCTYYEYTSTDYISNHATIYTQPIVFGDVIVFFSGTVWWSSPSHVVIITAYDTVNKDFKYSGHNNDRLNKPLLDVIGDYYRVRFICI